MNLSQIKSLSPFDRLVYWITERESIRLKKERGEPKPWTDDPVLQTYRFCNCRRMDDKVSRWLLEHWYKPYFDHPNMLVACAMARFFNNPDTLHYVGFPETWKPKQIKKSLRKFRQIRAGAPIFNAAYMVRGNDGADKIEAVIDHYCTPLVDDPPAVDPSSMRKTWEALVPRYGFGSFMAGQVVADMRHAVAGKWADRKRWAPAGPGSMRGLNRLLGEPLEKNWKQEEFLKALQTEVIAPLKKAIPRIMRRLEAIDAQNCLCELDKFNRALFGEGRPKQLYPGVK